MIINPDARLKIRRFFKKYGKLVGIIVFIWIAIVIVNKLLGEMDFNSTPTTTYKPHTSVLDEQSKAPKKVQKAMEDFVKEYVEYCNNGELEKAYNMISDECKEYNFNTFADYTDYISNKFTYKKKYTIQNYSNFNGKYIYVVKFYDDFLATGLTNSTYMFQEEKIVASYDKNKNVVFSVGNFVEQQDIQSVQENDYLKIDVKSKIVKYSLEIYDVKITNKSDKTVVIKNGEIDDEILLNLTSELREDINQANIILEPEETKTVSLVFDKFYDDGIDSKSIIFNSIRVVDNYIEYDPNEENSIYKFSMELGL